MITAHLTKFLRQNRSSPKNVVYYHRWKKPAPTSQLMPQWTEKLHIYLKSNIKLMRRVNRKWIWKWFEKVLTVNLEP